MNKKQSLLWLVAATVCAVGATTLILSSMVTDPGHVFMQLGGDCGKNYFTYLYHSIYGKGIWFEGMNYPYGEHIIYADGQPMLSGAMHFFQNVTVHDAIMAMDLCIGLSYVLAIVFTYKILIRFDVRPLLAILFACLINLFAPQVLRLEGHFALAYLCPIPMLFYWTLRYHSDHRWKWPAYILAMGILMAFTHLYIGAIIFFWILFYSIGYVLLIKIPFRERVRHIVPLLLAGTALFLVIKAGIALTDPVKDRPAFPLNTLYYVTHIKDIVSSPFSFFWQYIRYETKFSRIADGGEGYSYIGLVAVFFLLWSFAKGILISLKGERDKLLVSEQGFSPVWIFTGGGALLLAMGVPFVWHMQWLLDYLSVFKQFRAMGRFSWAFYYVATIYAAVIIHSIYTGYLAKNKPVIGYVVLVGAIGLWSLDLSRYIENIRGQIAKGVTTYDEFFYKDDPVKWPEFLAEHHYKGSDFQGILLLPMFFSGTEKIWVGGDPSWPLSIGMRPAIQFHLPIVDVMMSRTSWSLTQKQVKTAAGPYADKPMLRDLKSNKPFLLIQFDGVENDDDQQYLLSACDLLGHHFNAYIYAFYPERLIANDHKNIEVVERIAPYMHSRDSCVADKGVWYTDHFDSLHASGHLFGAGAAPFVDKDSLIVATIPVKPTGDSQKYEFSAWFLLDNKDYRSPFVNLQSLDSNGKVISTIDALTKLSVDNEGMWFRSSVYLYLKPRCRTLRCVVVNEVHASYEIMDELMLRPADAVIISKATDGKLMVNNHLIHNSQ